MKVCRLHRHDFSGESQLPVFQSMSKKLMYLLMFFWQLHCYQRWVCWNKKSLFLCQTSFFCLHGSGLTSPSAWKEQDRITNKICSHCKLIDPLNCCVVMSSCGMSNYAYYCSRSVEKNVKDFLWCGSLFQSRKKPALKRGCNQKPKPLVST